MSQSLARALQILNELGRRPSTLDELAEVTEVHKTTVLRLLRTLAEDRFVFRDGTHRYHLGARIFELSSRALDQHEVRRIAGPHLSAFNRKFGRTTHLAAMEGDEVVYIDKLESHDHIVMYSRIGLRAALHSTAVAKILLADLPADELGRLISGITFERRTPNTIPDADRLRTELDLVRRQGWAVDREENEASINCIAAPIRGASGKVLAAVSVSVPDAILGYDQVLDMLPALRQVTDDISRDCGYLAA